MPLFKDSFCGAVKGLVRVRNYITLRAFEFKAWVIGRLHRRYRPCPVFLSGLSSLMFLSVRCDVLALLKIKVAKFKSITEIS
jgi:hypothetical protein